METREYNFLSHYKSLLFQQSSNIFAIKKCYAKSYLSAAPKDVNEDRLCLDEYLLREEWTWTGKHLPSMPFMFMFKRNGYLFPETNAVLHYKLPLDCKVPLLRELDRLLQTVN